MLQHLLFKHGKIFARVMPMSLITHCLYCEIVSSDYYYTSYTLLLTKSIRYSLCPIINNLASGIVVQGRSIFLFVLVCKKLQLCMPKYMFNYIWPHLIKGGWLQAIMAVVIWVLSSSDHSDDESTQSSECWVLSIRMSTKIRMAMMAYWLLIIGWMFKFQWFFNHV